MKTPATFNLSDRPPSASTRKNFPSGWDEDRVRRHLQHYESLTKEDEVAEDEAAFGDSMQTMMVIPNELVPSVRALLSEHTG